jgi:RsiW-degrading membrane proteinase PrsW (M82 family)
VNVLIQRNNQTFGPYPANLVEQYLKQGRIFLHDLARVETMPSSQWLSLHQLLDQTGHASLGRQSFLEKLKSLDPGLMFPWQEIRSAQWLTDRKLLCLAGIGLAPATLLAISSEATVGYWAIALYFSVLWSVFFYYLFKTPQVQVALCCLCFFGTGMVCIPVLLTIQHLPPIPFFLGLAHSEVLPLRALGMFFGVGLWEELSKAAILFWLVRRPGIILIPQTAVFYGMISGLGFGIYEGVSYQQTVNREQGVDAAYFLNIARLTSLPFLHAIWTGIAGYFIGFSALFASKRFGLWICALLIPAALHAFYNTLGWSLFGLAVGLLGVVLLMTYLANCRKTQSQLGLLAQPAIIMNNNQP